MKKKFIGIFTVFIMIFSIQTVDGTDMNNEPLMENPEKNKLVELRRGGPSILHRSG